jgi:hypothetical protein
MLAQL